MVEPLNLNVMKVRESLFEFALIGFFDGIGYVLHGPTGLTCNHGQWMPAERPRCILGKLTFPFYLANIVDCFVFRKSCSIGSPLCAMISFSDELLPETE